MLGQYKTKHEFLKIFDICEYRYSQITKNILLRISIWKFLRIADIPQYISLLNGEKSTKPEDSIGLDLSSFQF